MIFGVRKLRVMGLSCSVICVILRLAVLIQYRSMTDRHTHTHTTTAYTTLSIASRCRNGTPKPKISRRLPSLLRKQRPHQYLLTSQVLEMPIKIYLPAVAVKEVVAVEVTLVEVTLLKKEDLAFKEIGVKVSPQILGVSSLNQTGNPHKFGRNSQKFNSRCNNQFSQCSSSHLNYLQCSNLIHNRGLRNQPIFNPLIRWVMDSVSSVVHLDTRTSMSAQQLIKHAFSAVEWAIFVACVAQRQGQLTLINHNDGLCLLDELEGA